MEVRIIEVYEERDEYNKLSGHHYKVRGKLRGYEVFGGMFDRTFHKTLKAAERRVEFIREYRKKYPFKPHRSRREVRYMKKHGKPIEDNATIFDFCTKCGIDFSVGTGCEDSGETVCQNCKEEQ